MTDQDIINALIVVAKKYGKGLASTIERIFRNETAHFKSGGFLKTLSPGMEAFADSFPYGWSTPAKFWEESPTYSPKGLEIERENSSAMLKSRGDRKFIVFPTIEASMMTVAYIIHTRGGNGGAWFSVSNEEAQKKYNAILSGIIPRFVNANIK